MKVEFDKSFLKSLEKLNDPLLKQRVGKIIVRFEAAENIQSVPNVKKLTGYSTFYRVKIGNYRLGFEKIDAGTIRIIIILHRKDIYSEFP